MTSNFLLRKAALFVTEKCNLRCTYCYQKRNPENIKSALAMRAIDFLLKNSGNVLTLSFFGGEPLTELPLLIKLMDYSREKFLSQNKKIAFSINTNGTLLSQETLKTLSKNRVNIILSIDGKKDSHDRNRKTSTGKGSYSLIEKNFDYIINYPSIQARITVNPEGISELVENIDYLSKLGFKKLGIALTRDTERWNKEKIKELREEYNLLAEWYIKAMKESKEVSIADMDIFIAKGKRTLKTGRPPCSAGEKSIAVGIDGLIYPCHRFVGHKEAVIGNIENGLNEEKRNKYRTFDPYKVKGCEKCSLLSDCYKCMWLSFIKKGDLNTRVEVACEESKAFISTAEKVRIGLEKNSHYMKRISILEKIIEKGAKK